MKSPQLTGDTFAFIEANNTCYLRVRSQIRTLSFGRRIDQATEDHLQKKSLDALMLKGKKINLSVTTNGVIYVINSFVLEVDLC
jgi:hypothetical protein